MIASAKHFNDIFAIKNNCWKLKDFFTKCSDGQSFQNQSSDTMTTDSKKMSERQKLKQERIQLERKQFRAIMEECYTMLHSHKNKHQIKNENICIAHNKDYLLRLEIKGIVENLGLDYFEDNDMDSNVTSILIGSKDVISQFAIEIYIDNSDASIITNQCAFKITVAKQWASKQRQLSDVSDDDDDIELTLSESDNDSIANDISLILSDGNYRLFTQKLLLLKHFFKIQSNYPQLCQMELYSFMASFMNNYAQTIPQCGYSRLLEGPSLTYAESLLDSISLKIKPSQSYTITYAGLLPHSCYGSDVSSSNVSNIGMPNLSNDSSDISDNNSNNLLHWFVLRPAVILPLEMAEQIHRIAMGKLSTNQSNDNSAVDDNEMKDERYSAHSSMCELEYTYHRMMVGNGLQSNKPTIHKIGAFSSDDSINSDDSSIQHYYCKNGEIMGCGVRLEAIALRNVDISLPQILTELRTIVLFNELYLQCFNENASEKWLLPNVDKSPIGIENTNAMPPNINSNQWLFDTFIYNSNHLHICPFYNESNSISVSENVYYNWSAHFYVCSEGKISLSVQLYPNDNNETRDETKDKNILKGKKM